MMKKILILLLILTLLSGCAKEVSLPAPDLEADLNLWVSPMGKKMSETRPLNAVQWHWDDKTGDYSLFLPSEGRLSALQVWFAGTADCALNGKPLQNGQKISLKQTGTYALTLNGADYTLHVMKSANIGSLYLSTESGSMDHIHTEKGNKEKGALLRSIDYYYALLEPSAAMNYALWQNIDIPTNKNYVHTGSTFREHYDYLANYVSDRTAYLNDEWSE